MSKHISGSIVVSPEHKIGPAVKKKKYKIINYDFIV